MLQILLTSCVRFDTTPKRKQCQCSSSFLGFFCWFKKINRHIFYLQAFNLTSNATESLDEMLTESLKSKMPATSFQLFGVKQIEEDNMAACECRSLALTRFFPLQPPCLYHYVMGAETAFRSQHVARQTVSDFFLHFRSKKRGTPHAPPLCCKVRPYEADRRSPAVSRSSAGLQRDEQTRRLPKQAGREERLLRPQAADG